MLSRLQEQRLADQLERERRQRVEAKARALEERAKRWRPPFQIDGHECDMQALRDGLNPYA